MPLTCCARMTADPPVHAPSLLMATRAERRVRLVWQFNYSQAAAAADGGDDGAASARLPTSAHGPLPALVAAAARFLFSAALLEHGGSAERGGPRDSRFDTSADGGGGSSSASSGVSFLVEWSTRRNWELRPRARVTPDSAFGPFLLRFFLYATECGPKRSDARRQRESRGDAQRRSRID